MKHRVTKDMPERFQIVVSVNVLLRKDGKYLLLRRANTGWADGYFTLPAGHLEADEPLTAAAVREIKEEVGVNLDPEHLVLQHVMHRSDKEDDQERLDFYFLATQWDGEPYVAEPDKADQIGWYAADDLPEHTLENVARIFALPPSQILTEVNW